MNLRRKTPLRRAGRLKRSRLKARNEGRAAKRREECFGPQADLCRHLTCVACDPNRSLWTSGMTFLHRSEPHHEPTRAAGGKDKDTVPLCRAHHDERHRIGRAEFETRHGVDLQAIAKAIHEELQGGKSDG